MGEEFNVSLFEKKLQGLKDSQESINSLSAWCLENRQHHKKIVQAWLNVLKRVKVEHRLTLFYLANDVIQYSKRKNYEFVESWGTTLQKATTMVREEKVKHRILRIFKIWEQRGIYGEEFLSDLSGLISVAPAKKSETEPLEFQPSYLISKINACTRLEEDTDLKLKRMKENEHKLLCDDPDAVVASLKDRQRVEDVEKEVEDSIKLVDAVMGALKAEISARKHLLNLLTQADNFYRTQRGEVKVVSNAYKNFGLRVKNLKKRLDEMLQDESRWSSPIPSPDVNAPSPSPDSDIELPGQDELGDTTAYSLDQSYTAANFYTPIGSDQSNSFTNNGFTSFLGSNISFDIHANLFNDSNTASHVSDTPVPPPSNNLIEVVGSSQTSKSSSMSNNQPPAPQQNSFSLNNIINQLLPKSNSQMASADMGNPDHYQTTQQPPLLPPPMPPFTSPPATYPTNNVAYSDPVYPPMNDNSFGGVNTSYQQMPPSYIPPPEVQQPPNIYGAPINDQGDYNPEEELETWENDGAWPEPPDMETPESPPGYEKEGVSEPVEYHDGPNHSLMSTVEDVDHRILLPPPHLPSHLADIKGPDTDHRVGRSANKDIDHRNLISLTGSPGPETTSSVPAPPIPPNLWNIDQDYRMHGKDQDYRAPPPMMQHFVHLASEPPPPPPPMVVQVPTTNTPTVNKLKRGPSAMLRRSTTEDNVESIDMELSDDDQMAAHHIKRTPPKDRIMLAKHHGHHQHGILESPPVPPTLEDDVDATANNIIETINQDDFLEGLTEMNTSEPPPTTPGGPDNQNFKERGWYNNEWSSPNGVQYNHEFPPPGTPPAGLLRPPGDFRRPLEFQGPPPPPLPHNFRGGGMMGGPPVFPRPPPPPTEQQHFQHFGSGENSFQGHFRGGMNRGGNRGGGWAGNNNKLFINNNHNRGNHHNRGGGSHRGGYHQSPRGGRGGNNSFRGGRGRGGGNYREQW
ncbi:uncharacterized protein LOC123300368 isoform X2 [Chrysoperla carnea]|uniref:uncharacterized protein LOC123300368 isoform X2 n=1 Tax=Chrysoperla carnea TaxID=189513 RepID=UPI001D08BA13|nr:uncharacterized protein LOC123300368 isoform X2 [Chrysoperla carnea]